MIHRCCDNDTHMAGLTAATSSSKIDICQQHCVWVWNYNAKKFDYIDLFHRTSKESMFEYNVCCNSLCLNHRSSERNYRHGCHVMTWHDMTWDVIACHGMAWHSMAWMSWHDGEKRLECPFLSNLLHCRIKTICLTYFQKRITSQFWGMVVI